ncbi:hypothetical protein BO99DRAFT_51463 [Aspergillus violaceofuscus CBS 115571]|uniref:Uncharacterized protein n=1 Tax=Aspergillus violaceofuscus (strain CBS 115571) TaxID=1450538 RepID=A0A2V5IPP9_ASPV1|nr:hypothetical protein BO99DRAFT_51463 [Aspergillus violaceofuscus CBS 115571]
MAAYRTPRHPFNMVTQVTKIVHSSSSQCMLTENSILSQFHFDSPSRPQETPKTIINSNGALFIVGPTVPRRDVHVLLPARIRHRLHTWDWGIPRRSPRINFGLRRRGTLLVYWGIAMEFCGKHPGFFIVVGIEWLFGVVPAHVEKGLVVWVWHCGCGNRDRCLGLSRQI